METVNHEHYVSLEVAKLLRKAGFNWECSHYYQVIPGTENVLYPSIKDGWEEDLYPAPTLDIAQRWMREVKNIYVESVLCANGGTSGYSYGFSIAEVSADLSIVKILYPSTYFDEEESKGFLKYELSLEAGMKKALEIILKK